MKKFNLYRRLLFLPIGILLILSACEQKTDIQKRPNIIFIMSDDHA